MHTRSGSNNGEVVTEMLKGAIAGALGIWALDRVTWFMWDREASEALAQEREARPGGLDPTHVMANRAASVMGQELTPRQPNPTGIAAHYALGVLPGVMYGALHHRMGRLGAARGLLLGLGLFLLQDELAKWLLGTSGAPTDHPWQAHAHGVVGHLAYEGSRGYRARDLRPGGLRPPDAHELTRPRPERKTLRNAQQHTRPWDAWSASLGERGEPRSCKGGVGAWAGGPCVGEQLSGEGGTVLEKTPSRREQLRLFARNFLKHPKMLGSVIPSSRFLIRKVLEPVDWERTRVVVEYGPGVGNFTGELLRRMRSDSTLIVVETNPEFVRFLRESFSDERLQVVHGSAAEIDEILKQRAKARADYIISGIPFSTMPEDLRESILKTTRAVLDPRGAFLVYQFSARVLPDLERIFGHVGRGFEPLNILPAQLFFCEPKPA